MIHVVIYVVDRKNLSIEKGCSTFFFIPFPSYYAITLVITNNMPLMQIEGNFYIGIT